MKILHAVESYWPATNGAQAVVQQISERLAKAGHDVTVVARKLPNRTSLEHNGVKIVEFDVIATTPKSISTATGVTGETKQYQDFLRKGNFDIIMTYAAQQWTSDLMFDVLDDIEAKKVIVPCGYSALYDPDFKDYFEKLPTYLKKFDAIVYICEDYRDVEFGKKNGLTNTHFIPNGADEQEFSNPISEEAKTRLKNTYGIGGLMIMSLGNYTGEKGHEELLWVYKRLPVSKATLVTAGVNHPHNGSFDVVEHQAWRINQSRKFLGKRMVMADGANRELVRDLLKTADLFVFLSNIECSPLLLFEAAAAGVPFVATAAGNSAEIARWTGGGIIVKTNDRPNGRVKADLKDALWQVTKLAHNRRRRQAIGRAGHEAWKKKFTWEKLAQDYLTLYESLLKDTKK